MIDTLPGGVEISIERKREGGGEGGGEGLRVSLTRRCFHFRSGNSASLNGCAQKKRNAHRYSLRLLDITKSTQEEICT